MPGAGGLPELVQPVGADTSRYIANFRATLPILREVNALQDEFLRKAAMVQDALRGIAGAPGAAAAAADIGKMNAAIREGLAQARQLADAQAAAAKTAADIGSASAVTVEQIRKHASSVEELTKAYSRLSVTQFEALDEAKMSLNEVQAALRAIPAVYGSVRDSADGVTASLGEQVRATDRSGESVLSYTRNLGALRSEARNTTSALADTAAAITAARAAGAGPSTINILGPELAAAVARSAGQPSPWSPSPAVVAAMAARSAAGGGGGGRGGGGGGGRGGGGGGGGMGPAPSFIPWAGGGWQAIRFWGMMGAEIASTVVPAVVAAGSAALVGAQGFEQLATRAQAVYAVSEALGPSLNQSFGSFVVGGKYGNALQQAQNAAQGTVYSIAGAGINLLRGGAGQGLLGMGTQTLDMINRSVAQFTVSAQQRGLGAQIAGLVGGGPRYLQEFGQVGANLGNLLLGVAPNLPGVGSDLLSTLVGGTGVLAAGARNIPGPLIGGLLSYEAASRWGPALLGGQGLIGRMLGLRGVGGLGGLISRGGEALFARGMGGPLGDVGLGLVGAGDALAGLAGWPLGLAGTFAYLIGKGVTAKTPEQQMVAGLQSQVAQGGFAGAWQPLGHAISQIGGALGALPAPPVPGAGPPGAAPQFAMAAAGRGGYAPGVRRAQSEATYQAALQASIQQMGDLVAAGPQLKTALRKAGMTSLSMADAFAIAQNAGLDLAHAFDKNGKLTAPAVAMLGNYVAAIGPMTRSGGAFGAAVSAQYIMGQSAMTNLSKVNQAMDSMTQIAAGGPAGMSGLFGMLGGAPVTTAPTRAGLRLKAPPAFSAMAQALTSFTTPGGAAAWQTFAGPQGLVSAEQANLDQLRTALTLGAISPQGAGRLAAFQIQQMLPLAKDSPAALALLMQQGAQMGVTPYYQARRPGQTAAQEQAANYQAAVTATGKIADNTAQANQATNALTIHLANLSKTAQQFAGNLSTSLGTQALADATKNLYAIRDAALKGAVDKTALSQFTADLKGAGITGAASIKGVLDAALQRAGVSATMRVKIEAQVLPVHPPKIKNEEFFVIPRVLPAHIPKYPDQSFNIIGHVVITGAGVSPYTPAGAKANLGPVAYLHQAGFRVPGYGGGDIHPAMLEGGEAVVPKHLVPAIAPFLSANRVPGFQGGGLIGLGPLMSPAILPAILNENFRVLEEMIAALAQQGGGGGTGFSGLWRGPAARILAGGPSLSAGTAANPVVVRVATSGTGGGGSSLAAELAAAQGAPPIPSAAQKVIDTFEKTFAKMGNPWGQFASQVLQSMLDSLKDPSKETAAMARALVKNVSAEVNYARSVAASTVSGLNLGGMQVATPAMTSGGRPYQYYTDQAAIAGGGSVSVQQQMGDYLQAIKSFGGDIKSLAKAGLTKPLLQQLLAAGPIQGDALAQSILSGPGGAKGANSLWKQINQAAQQLGITGAQAVYGQLTGKTVPAKANVSGAGQVHALQHAINSLQGKTVTVKVLLEIEGAGGGGGGGGKGNVPLTNQVEQALASHLSSGAAARSLQAATLKQAKRTGTSGLKLPGYAN